MPAKSRLRLIELLIAVAVIAVALVWAERAAWHQISGLRAEMTSERLAEFRSADALRAAILELHNEWRLGIEDTNDAGPTAVERRGLEVDALIKLRMSTGRSPVETRLNEQIMAAYKEYLALLSESLNTPNIVAERAASGNAEEGAQTSLERLLALTEELTANDRAAAERFVTEANASLMRLQRFLFVALLGLLVSGIAIVVVAYRRTIAPLRSNLTQSRAIIERQEKLSSLGVFAAGIAHEVRNPLTAIKVRLFTLKGSHKPGSSEHEDLEVIRSEIDRLERIVSDFLQFARPADPELHTMPVDKLLQDVHDLLHTDLARKSVELKLELLAKRPVCVDPDKMKQVLINFVQNGAESIDASGTVTLRSRMDRQVLNGRYVSTVIIDVADTGKGIPPEVVKRLFDPFFTTKETGTGLGLPIAGRIVEKHGGVIQYQTQPNRGTTFSIVLPLAPEDEIQS